MRGEQNEVIVDRATIHPYRQRPAILYHYALCAWVLCLPLTLIVGVPGLPRLVQVAFCIIPALIMVRILRRVFWLQEIGPPYRHAIRRISVLRSILFLPIAIAGILGAQQWVISVACMVLFAVIGTGSSWTIEHRRRVLRCRPTWSRAVGMLW